MLMDAKDPSGSSGSLAALAPERRGVPRPGEIYDPVARALDVIGDRWSLVLVRHLLLGPKGFQELRVRTGIAPRVLSSRLRDLAAQGFVESVQEGSRSAYAVTERGRSLEPIVSSIARWFTRHGIDALQIDVNQFTETSPQSILESLPFLLREERARDADVTFEIRLTGPGGGVWTVHIHDGVCSVVPDFARRADVRYTADAKAWCGVALGLTDARELVKAGLMTKDGADIAMDHYFHQISRPGDDGARRRSERARTGDSPRSIREQERRKEKIVISFGPSEEQEIIRDTMKEFADAGDAPDCPRLRRGVVHSAGLPRHHLGARSDLDPDSGGVRRRRRSRARP